MFIVEASAYACRSALPQGGMPDRPHSEHDEIVPRCGGWILQEVSEEAESGNEPDERSACLGGSPWSSCQKSDLLSADLHRVLPHAATLVVVADLDEIAAGYQAAGDAGVGVEAAVVVF